MKTLYAVTGYKGAHIIDDVRDTQAGIIADVHLIGAINPFSAQVKDLTPFQMSDAIDPKEAGNDLIALLAQEAVTVYNLDPGRVQRAADLMRQPGNVQQAQRDELDAQITPSLKVIIVKGSKGWYVTRRGFCQCPDHAKGFTCKHQIAAWMLRESTVRPLAVARRRNTAQIMAELTA